MDKIKKKLKQKQENKNVISTLILLFSLLGFISLIILMRVKIKEVDNLIHDANESIKEKQFGIKAIQNMVSDIKTNNTNLLNKIEKLKHDLMGVKVQYDDNLLKIGKAENEKKSIRTLEFPMIMKTIEDKDFVMSTLPYASQNFYNMKLLYKASRDGRTKEDFYNHCKDKYPTITLIKTKKMNRFGGYFSERWNQNEGFVNDKEAYVFNLDKRKKYDVIKPSLAVYIEDGFPNFGGRDIVIGKKLINGNSYSDFPNNYGKGNEEKRELTNFENNFEIEDLEVYLIDLE